MYVVHSVSNTVILSNGLEALRWGYGDVNQEGENHMENMKQSRERYA